MLQTHYHSAITDKLSQLHQVQKMQANGETSSDFDVIMASMKAQIEQNMPADRLKDTLVTIELPLLGYSRADKMKQAELESRLLYMLAAKESANTDVIEHSFGLKISDLDPLPVPLAGCIKYRFVSYGDNTATSDFKVKYSPLKPPAIKVNPDGWHARVPKDAQVITMKIMA